MKRIIFTLAVTAALVPAAASAEEGKGFYGSLNFGLNTVSGVPVQIYDADGAIAPTIDGKKDTIDSQYNLKSAAMFGGTLGYDFGMVRTDLEVTYARNRIKSISIGKLNGTTVELDTDAAASFCDYSDLKGCTLEGADAVAFPDGPRLRQLSAMANLWLDLPTGGKVVPYLGAGAGISGFEIDGEGKGKFAWQLGAGAAFHLTRTIALTADLRHRQVKGGDIAYDTVSGFRLDKIKTTSFGIGLRAGF